MATPNHLHILYLRENATANLPRTEEEIDYAGRAQWLRAAVLGADDGLVSVASLMMGIGAIRDDVKAMILTGFAGLLAGACSMAVGEFVSVYSQLDMEMKREKGMAENGERERLPNDPLQAAMASALAFSFGAILPLLAAAFISNHKLRLGVVVAAATLGLAASGGAVAVLGKTKVVSSCGRVVVGGWMAMTITFGLTKLLGTTSLHI